MQAKLSTARLYGILDMGYVADRDIERIGAELIAGGVDLLQLRAKGIPPDRILGYGSRLLPLCRSAGVPLIINDHPELALELGADGLHVGQDDGCLAELRSIIGPQMMVGRSTHSPEQARQALADGFDYIGFGPLFATPTKLGRPGIGLENLAAVEAEIGPHIPVFGIGGITRGNLETVLEAGARRVVIVSDLLTARGVAAATRAVKLRL